jgi:hypothetical protein
VHAVQAARLPYDVLAREVSTALLQDMLGGLPKIQVIERTQVGSTGKGQVACSFMPGASEDSQLAANTTSRPSVVSTAMLNRRGLHV